MAPSLTHRKPPKRLVPSRIDVADYEAMARLAEGNECSVASEYRAAIKAWIEQHTENAEKTGAA